jgi:site-specific DNA-methyltransferase (cytosine-N4-specific)
MITQNIRDRFTIPLPLLLIGKPDTVKLELKPYLQPFERGLAMRELKALLRSEDTLTEQDGFWFAHTNISEEYLQQRLTYWQRIGRNQLAPTLQKSLEFTQNGSAEVINRSQLHRSRRLRYGPHDLHEYRGKFFPQLVRSLINISGINEGALVLDPMCGSGTTLCEAVVSGHAAIGADLNPLSALIARVKATIPLLDPAEFHQNTNGYLDGFKFPNVEPASVWNEDDLRYLNMWFASTVISELASIVSEINEIKSSVYRDLFRVFLSNIVRTVSWQKVDDLRIRKEVLPDEPGSTRKRFLAEATNQIDRIYPYLLALELKSSAHAEIRLGNAVNVVSIFPELQGAVDLVITSPPYATALPYLETDRLSLIVLGLLPRKNHSETEHHMVGTREISEKKRRDAWISYEARRSELPIGISSLIDQIALSNHNEGVGFRRRNLPALLSMYFLSMLDAMRSAHALMKPKSFGYYIVGNNSTEVSGKKIEIPTDNFLFELGAAAGLKPIEKIPMELIASRDIFRENRGSSETILCFQA